MAEREDPLVEAACTAWRPRDPRGGLRAHPAWHDLDESGRRVLFDQIAQSRALEAALDADGLSTTAKAVLARIRAAR
jgi:hypothetical protein